MLELNSYIFQIGLLFHKTFKLIFGMILEDHLHNRLTSFESQKSKCSFNISIDIKFKLSIL